MKYLDHEVGVDHAHHLAEVWISFCGCGDLSFGEVIGIKLETFFFFKQKTAYEM